MSKSQRKLELELMIGYTEIYIKKLEAEAAKYVSSQQMELFDCVANLLVDLNLYKKNLEERAK